jgi:hypothetical protein
MMRANRAFGIAIALALTSSIAVAEGPGGSAAGTAGTSKSSPSKEVPQTSVAIPATPDPVPVPDPAMTDAKLEEIRTRAREMQPSKRESIEKQLTASSKRVDTEAARLGEIPVRDRLAAEFGVAPEALAAQREHLGMGWGELMIAHLILANADGELTIEQIGALRKEGLGWGQLAHGAGLNTTGFVTAVKNEALVARGTSKPDGKPAVVASTMKASGKGSAKGKGNEVTPPASAPPSGTQTPVVK